MPEAPENTLAGGRPSPSAQAAAPSPYASSPDAPITVSSPALASAIERAVQQGLEVERRDLPSTAELERLTRQLRYREAVDQRWLRLAVGLSVFGVSILWLVADVVLTLAVGWGEFAGRPFKLDSTVVIAFLTTSTATVIGLFLVFLRWLYPQVSGHAD